MNGPLHSENPAIFWFYRIAGFGAIVGGTLLSRRANDRDYRANIDEQQRLVADARKKMSDERRFSIEAQKLLDKIERNRSGGGYRGP